MAKRNLLNRRRRRVSGRAGRWLTVFALIGAVLLAQGLARVHGIEHAPWQAWVATAAPAEAWDGASHAHGHGDEHGEEHAQAHHGHASSSSHDPWSHDPGSEACQWLDHLLTAQHAGHSFPAAFAHAVFASWVQAPADSPAPGLAWRIYEARGPPLG